MTFDLQGKGKVKGEKSVESLQERLGYSFRNTALLENALAHSSYANEHRDRNLKSNERLEFFGDSVLGFVVAEHLFRHRPDLPEGELTRIRASLVCESSLVAAAQSLDLGHYLKLGKGEKAGGGRHRPSILADALEAIFAAVYLDGGIGEARALIRRLILDQETARTEATRDYKTVLQELVQRESGQQLLYSLVSESGPDHAKHFTMAVLLNGNRIGLGEGRSKKEAEQAAARAAMSLLEGAKS